MHPPNTLIVYQAPWDWQWLRTRAQPLAEALSERATVVYVDSGARGVRKLSRLVHLTTPGPIARRIPFGFQVRPVEPGQNRLLRVTWRTLPLGQFDSSYMDRPGLSYTIFGRWLRRFAKGFDRVWLLTSRPKLTGMFGAYHWDRVIIDVEDPWPQMRWADALAPDELNGFVGRADLVTANGQPLVDLIQPYSRTPVVNLPNGVDGWLVDELGRPGVPKPEYLADTGRSRVVYTGAVEDRLDFPALNRLVTAVPGCDYYFIGPKFPCKLPDAAASQAELFTRPNVFHVAQRPHSEIPKILAHADYLLLPFGPMGGAAMFPGKLLEYTATGKPILSLADFRQSGVPLPSFLYCPDADRLVVTLSQLVAGKPVLPPEAPAAARRVAAESTWRSRADKLFSLAAQSQ
jgi:glycosyltransferase involved in cell wall biosynthesis